MLMDPVPADNVERPNLPVPPESFHDSWRGLWSVIFKDPYSQREDDIRRTGCQLGSKAPEVMPADLSRIIHVPVQGQIGNAGNALVAPGHGRRSAARRRRACGGGHVGGPPLATSPMQLVHAPVQREIVNARIELVALAHGRKSAARRRRGRACGGAHVDGAPGTAGPMQLV